jgi:parvulin-like peptidyl-prolyl isomerase
VKKNNRMTDKEFSKALSSMGMSLTAYKDGMKRDIIRSKFMGRILGSRVTVTKDEVEFYYNRRGSAFLLPSEIRLGQILLLTRGDMIEDEKAAVKSQAQRILERIRGGEDFAELASQYSQVPGEGGDLGYVKKGEINSDIEKVVFSLKNGEVSDLTETSLGYHIFKILDIKDENKKPLSEVREEIENILFNEKLEVVYKEWLESMKAKSYIDVRL